MIHLTVETMFAYLKMRRRVPVEIVERIGDGKGLLVFKKYVQKRLFLGKLPVLEIVMIGLSSCTIWGLTSWFHSTIQNELISILSLARIDSMTYRVHDFFEKGGKLVIQVAKMAD